MPIVNLSKKTDKPLYTKSDCIPLSEGADLAGKILVLDKSMLFGEYERPEYQLVLCRNGHAVTSKAIKCVFLADKEKSEFCLDEFIGELKPWRMPDWADAVIAERRRTAERLARKNKRDN